MPWDKFTEDGGRICIYKVDEEGDKTGDSLGCHDTEAEADAQLAALYASEPQAAKVAPEPEVKADDDAEMQAWMAEWAECAAAAGDA